MISRENPIIGYFDWRNLTWQSISLFGYDKGILLMHEIYPEWQKGEYQFLLNSYDPARATTPGALVSLARKFNPDRTNKIIKNSHRHKK